MHGRSWPSVAQFSVFLENRVGQLSRSFAPFRARRSDRGPDDLRLSRLLDPPAPPESSRARPGNPPPEQLAFAENELLVAELPTGPPSLSDMCAALLQAEINIHYAYPLSSTRATARPCRLHVDNIEQANRTLHSMGFDLLCEADLAS